ECLFVRRGRHRVGTLGANTIALDAESSVLSCTIVDGAAGIHAQNAQILGEIAAIENPRAVVFIDRTNHLRSLPTSSFHASRPSGLPTRSLPLRARPHWWAGAASGPEVSARRAG